MRIGTWASCLIIGSIWVLSPTSFGAQLGGIPNQFNQAGPKVHFYPHLGLALESTNDVITHLGYNYIPLVHSLKPAGSYAANFRTCPRSRVSTTLVRTIETMLDSIIPTVDRSSIQRSLANGESHPGSRNKRFITGLIAGVLGGMSIWNRISVSRLDSKVSALQSFVNENVESINNLKTATVQNHGDIAHIIMVLNQASARLMELESSFNCSVHDIEVAVQVMTSYGLFGPAEFMRAVDGALQGRITPDLISPSVLKKMVKDHPELRGTIFQRVPGLIYELGHFYLSRVSKSPYRIEGVMILPHIKKYSYGQLYTVGTVSYFQDGMLFKLDLPSTVVVSDDSRLAWTIDPLECRVSQAIISCPTSLSLKNIHSCLTQLIFSNHSNDCPVLVKGNTTSPQPDAIQFQSGVLIGAAINEWTMVRVQGSRQISTDRHREKESPSAVFLTSRDGDHVLINGTFYPLILHSEDYHVQFYTPSEISYPLKDLPPLESLVSEWKPAAELSRKRDYFHWESPIWPFVLFLLAGIIIMILGILIYVYRRRVIAAHARLRDVADWVGLIPRKQLEKASS